MTREQLQGSFLLVLAVVAFQVGLFAILDAVLPTLDRTTALTQIVQSFATATLLIGGGLLVAVRYELFRNFIPHVTVSQVVSHRPISDSYVHLMVAVTLHNSSKVKIDFQECYFQLQMLAPASDEEVETLYAEVFTGEDSKCLGDFQWNTLDKKTRSWVRNELTIEPGESHQETCEFIVTSEVLSVLAYTYFYNTRRPFLPEGWGVTTAYDIIAKPSQVIS